MSGLERLLKFAGGYSYISSIRIELMEIADEIERDFKEATNGFNYYDTLFNKAKLLGKPFREDEPIDIDNWLDRWYLPRPVIGGEPVQFGDELVYLKDSSYLRIESISMHENGYCYLNGYKMSRLSRELDSIDNLRKDIVEFMGEHSDIDTHHIANTIATEWLSRADNLFGGGE